MKFSAVALAATSGTLVAAQLDMIGDLLPECAVGCLTTALGSVSECGVDVSCYCKPENQETIKKQSQDCLKEQCSPEDAEKAVSAGESLCAGSSGSGSMSMPMPTGEGTAPGTMESTPSMTMPHTSASMGHSTAMSTHNSTMVMPTPTNGGAGGDDDSDDDSGGADTTGSGSSPGATPTEGAANAPAVGIAAAIMAAVFAL